MKRMTLTAIVACCLGCGPGGPGDPARVEDPWIRGAPPTASVMAAYLRVIAGDTGMTINGARCDGFGRTEMHETVIRDGVATMRPLDPITMAAGETVEFAPGGHHLMLMEAAAIPVENAEVHCALVLAGNRELTFAATVRRGGDSGDTAHEHHH